MQVAFCCLLRSAYWEISYQKLMLLLFTLIIRLELF
jgi:hypothetical protein